MTDKKVSYNKMYYDKNREKIIKHLGEKKLCEVCQREYPLYHLYRHFKSKKHIDNLSKNGLKE